MAGPDYAKSIVEDVIKKEVLGTLKAVHQDHIDLAIIVSIDPKIRLKPYNKQIVYSEDDTIWGIDPKSLFVGDTVIIARNPVGRPIIINKADAQNQDPTLHPEGSLLKSNLLSIRNQVKSWHPYVKIFSDLPVSGNQQGDCRLVLEENTIYYWNDPTEQWSAIGSDLEYLADLMDVKITDPKNGDFLVFDKDQNKWVNKKVDILTEDKTKLPLSGGKMSGNILMPAGTEVKIIDNPVESIDAVNKMYVDDKVSYIVDLISESVSLISTYFTDEDYTLQTTDQVILVDCSSSTITITLPETHLEGKIYYIKDWKGSAYDNNITIVSEDGDYIDGDTSFILDSAYSAITLVSDGNNWCLV